MLLAATVDIASALIAAGGIVLGVVLTSITAIIQAAAIRRSEERKIIYDIASKLAAEQWKLDVERTDAANREIKETGIWNISRDKFQIPTPRISQTVRWIITDIESATRRKSIWSRFQAWRSDRRAKKKEEAEQDTPSNR